MRASFHPGRASEESGVVGARNFLKRKGVGGKDKRQLRLEKEGHQVCLSARIK